MRARAGTHGTRASRGLRRARGRPPQRRVRPSSPWERSGRGFGAPMPVSAFRVPCAVRREYYRRATSVLTQSAFRRARRASLSLDAFWNALLRQDPFPPPARGRPSALPAVAFSLLGASGGPWKQPAVGLLAPRPLYSRNAGNQLGLLPASRGDGAGKTLGTHPATWSSQRHIAAKLAPWPVRSRP